MHKYFDMGFFYPLNVVYIRIFSCKFCTKDRKNEGKIIAIARKMAICLTL